MRSDVDTRPAAAPADPFEAPPPPGRASLAPGWLVEEAAAERETPVAVPPAARQEPRAATGVVAARAVAARTRIESVAAWRRFAHRFGSRSSHRTAAGAVARPRIPAYPLVGAAWLHDLSPAQRRLLVHDFRATTPRREWGAATAAESHLRRSLRLWPLASWDELHGLHVVLGVAGAGKTTLVLKLGRQLAAAGRRVAVLAFCPRPGPQAAAFRAAAELASVTAAVVPTPADWADARAPLADCDVLLVDTPCCLSEPHLLHALLSLPEMRRPESSLHHAVCLHHGPEFLLRQLKLAAAHGVDYLALSQADLAPGFGALLELQARPPVSFVNASRDLDAPLVSPGADALLLALGCRPAD